MGVDTCCKDLSREDILSNCLLSSTHLNREYYYPLAVLVSKGLVQFVYLPFAKALEASFSLHLGKLHNYHR